MQANVPRLQRKLLKNVKFNVHELPEAVVRKLGDFLRDLPVAWFASEAPTQPEQGALAESHEPSHGPVDGRRGRLVEWTVDTVGEHFVDEEYLDAQAFVPSNVTSTIMLHKAQHENKFLRTLLGAHGLDDEGTDRTSIGVANRQKIEEALFWERERAARLGLN